MTYRVRGAGQIKCVDIDEKWSDASTYSTYCCFCRTDVISEEHFHSAFASSEPDYQLRAAVAPRVSCATAPSPRQPREPPAAVHAEIRPLVRLYRCGGGQYWCC